MIDDIKKLFKKGFFHIFGSSVINKCISFLSSVVLVRILTKQEYGVFTYAWNIYSILILLLGLGSDSAILQMCSEKSDDKNFTDAITNYGTKLGLRFNLLLCVTLIGLGIYIPLPISGARKLLLILSLMPMFQYLYNISLICLRYKSNNQGYSKIAVTNTMVMFITSTGGALLLRESGMVIGHYISYAVSIFVAMRFLNISFFKRNSTIDRKNKKSFIHIAFISMCNNSLSQLLYLLDVFVLGIVAADESLLASYKIAVTIPTALSFIPQALVTYIYTEFARNNRNGEWCLKRYKKILSYLGTFNICISAIMVIFAEYIIRIVFGAQYLDAVPIFRLLSLNYFISGTFRTISGNLLVTQRKLKFNLFVALSSGVINILADYFFIQWWGAMGAAIATIMVVVFSSICSTTCLIYTFKKRRDNITPSMSD